MKIGLISINAHTKVLNAASPLHTYVFQHFLERNGIESTIVDYKPVYYGAFDVRHPLFYYVDHPDKDEKKQKRLLKKWKTLFYEREYRYDRFEEFINKYYKKTDRCYDAKLLETEDLGFDCYICVTDVIWKYNPKNGFDKGYLLACKSMKGKKKIAYSASRGAKGYTASQEDEFFEYLSDFDYVSVREKSLQSYIKDLSGIEVPHVLDPVFLEKKEFYYNLAMEPEEENFVLIYIVMEKAQKLVEQAVRYAESHNLQVVELSENPEDANIPEGTSHKVVYDIGVEEWLGYMKRAKCIFTNSFHACCFSMIFNIQFFVGARSGDKIDSVLDMFNLSWRRIAEESVEDVINKPDICFEETNNLIEKYVQESTEFLLGAIRSLETKQHTPFIGEKEKDFFRERVSNRPTEEEVLEVQSDLTKKEGTTFWGKIRRIWSSN